MKYLVTILFFALCGVSYGQSITGSKTRTPGVWLSSKDTATNRTAADSIQIIANRADSSLRFYWSVGAPSRKIAFLNDIQSGTFTNRRIPFVNNLGQLKDTTGFTFEGSLLNIPGSLIATSVSGGNAIGGFATTGAGILGQATGAGGIGINSYSSQSHAGYFRASGNDAVILVRQDGGGGNLIQLQNVLVDKFIVDTSGAVTARLYSGTLSTAAQPNITSLGTLNGLTVSGTVSSTFLDVASNTTLGKLTVNGSGIPTTSIIQSGASGDIIRFGNSSNNSLVSIGYTGLISAPSVSATSLSGTLSTTAQPNITSLGTLSQLTVTGTVKASVLSSSTITLGNTTNFASYNYAMGVTTGNGLMLYESGQNKYRVRGWSDAVKGGSIDIFKLDGSTVGTRISGDDVTAEQFIKSGGTSSQSLMADGSVQTVTSGTYSANVTNITNLSGGTSYTGTYQRVGNIVTVYGQYLSTTSASGACEFQVALPIASNFTAGGQCIGTGSVSSTNGNSVFSDSNPATDKASIQFISTGSSLSVRIYFTFQYQLL